jgi:ADP-ribose pyrophosphatase YjhB (NUDIX family)
MKNYPKVNRYPVAIDCIIFGFDGREVKLLLIHRGFEPEKGKWSLMGGFVEDRESLDDAAARILKNLTGLENVYMEQLLTFGNPKRDPVERTFSVAYFALIDIHQYETQLTDNYRPHWFSLKEIPKLIFDHSTMVELGREKLRFKATHSPILFELLPSKFTIPQLHCLYESVFNKRIDKRNFSRKALSEGLLVKLKDKEKSSSRKGAFYFKLNKKKYDSHFNAANVFGLS